MDELPLGVEGEDDADADLVVQLLASEQVLERQADPVGEALERVGG